MHAGSEHTPFEDAILHITELLKDGLHAGHYEFTVEIKYRATGKCAVVVKAGPTRQFVVRQSEVPR